MLFSLSLVSVLSLHSHFILHTCSPHSYRILFSLSFSHRVLTMIPPSSRRLRTAISTSPHSVCSLRLYVSSLFHDTIFSKCFCRVLAVFSACILLTVRTPMRQRARVQRPVAPDFAHCHTPCPHRAAPCGALFLQETGERRRRQKRRRCDGDLVAAMKAALTVYSRLSRVEDRFGAGPIGSGPW